MSRLWNKVIVIIVCFLSVFLYYSNLPYDEIEKCPFCYGRRLCNGTSININRCYLKFFNTKNIYYGRYNNTEVIIKKLASDTELYDFDTQYNNYEFSNNYLMDVNGSYSYLIQMLNSLNASYDTIMKLRICHIYEYTEIVLQQYFISLKQDHFYDFSDEQYFLAVWFMLQINPEPIILQIFNAYNGWPVPKYFGSCGRLAVFEHCGHSLHNFLSAEWLLRIHFAEQLLLISFNFTFNHHHFVLYLTDLTMDNVVVDENFKLYIVDLEYIILTNKVVSQIGEYTTWQKIHKTEHITCKECLMFSVGDICNHDISDHNFYAVCKEFFDSSSKLLSSLPDYIEQQYHLEQLINNCINPIEDSSFARLMAAEKLLNTLKQIKTTEHFDSQNYNYMDF